MLHFVDMQEYSALGESLVPADTGRSSAYYKERQENQEMGTSLHISGNL